MTVYTKVTKKNAEEYLNDFLKKKYLSLKWFKSFLIDKNMKEDEINFSPQSLIKVWEVSSQYIKKDYKGSFSSNEEKELPLWFYLDKDYVEGYTIESLQIIEALIYYFGEVFILKYNLAWETFKVSKPITEYTLRPVIMLNDYELYPFQQVTTASVFTWHEEMNDKLSKTNLYDFYTSLEEYLN